MIFKRGGDIIFFLRKGLVENNWYGKILKYICFYQGDAPFTCCLATCGAMFKTSSDLKRHTKVHTGEKPYQCEYCDHKVNPTGGSSGQRTPLPCPLIMKYFPPLATWSRNTILSHHLDIFSSCSHLVKEHYFVPSFGHLFLM